MLRSWRCQRWQTGHRFVQIFGPPDQPIFWSEFEEEIISASYCDWSTEDTSHSKLRHLAPRAAHEPKWKGKMLPTQACSTSFRTSRRRAQMAILKIRHEYTGEFYVEPSELSFSARAFPIPEEAPVIRTTLLFHEKSELWGHPRTQIVYYCSFFLWNSELQTVAASPKRIQQGRGTSGWQRFVGSESMSKTLTVRSIKVWPFGQLPMPLMFWFNWLM